MGRGAALATAMLLGAIEVAAQTGSLSARVQFSLATQEPITRSEPPTWRVYNEPYEFHFKVSFQNESNEPIRLDQSRLRDALAFRVDRGGEIAVRVEWLPDLLDPVRIDPGKLLSWTVVVSRADAQPFTAGVYQVTRAFENFREAATTLDGKVWAGRVPDGTGESAIVVRPGETPAERALHHLLVAGEAEASGEYEAALDAYKRATAENPSDAAGLLGMADTYLILSRYQEALALYQDVAARPGFAEERIAPFLAQAYVGVGDLASAAKVLQSLGLSVDEVATSIENMRRRVAR